MNNEEARKHWNACVRRQRPAVRVSSYSGVGLLPLLTVAFVVLRLCGVIDWSWWWVLAPTWIPFALFMLAALVCVALGIVSLLLGKSR